VFYKTFIIEVLFSISVFCDSVSLLNVRIITTGTKMCSNFYSILHRLLSAFSKRLIVQKMCRLHGIKYFTSLMSTNEVSIETRPSEITVDKGSALFETGPNTFSVIPFGQFSVEPHIT
jgi:hypothetical protein